MKLSDPQISSASPVQKKKKTPLTKSAPSSAGALTADKRIHEVLEGLGMCKYWKHFSRSNVRLEMLHKLSDEDWKSLGLPQEIADQLRNFFKQAHIKQRRVRKRDLRRQRIEANLVKKEIIGEGSFGRVYRGYYEGTEVAIKELVIGAGSGQKDFHHELVIMKKLTGHDNVLSLMEYNDSPPFICMISEYCKLGSVDKWLAYTKADIRLTLRIMEHVAKGMSFLTEEHIIHRDLASRNILIDSVEPTFEISEIDVETENNSSSDSYDTGYMMNDTNSYQTLNVEQVTETTDHYQTLVSGVTEDGSDSSSDDDDDDDDDDDEEDEEGVEQDEESEDEEGDEEKAESRAEASVDPAEDTDSLDPLLAALLKEAKCQKYTDKFVQDEVAFEDLVAFTEKDLEDMGIPRGPRKRLLLRFNEKKKELEAEKEKLTQAATAEEVETRIRAPSVTTQFYNRMSMGASSILGSEVVPLDPRKMYGATAAQKAIDAAAPEATQSTAQAEKAQKKKKSKSKSGKKKTGSSIAKQKKSKSGKGSKVKRETAKKNSKKGSSKRKTMAAKKSTSSKGKKATTLDSRTEKNCALPTGAAPFITVKGDQRKKWDLEAGVTTIGRSNTNDVTYLSDESLSRRHGEFTKKSKVVYFKDVGSSAGSLLNGVRLERATLLKKGDVLKMGQSEFVFSYSIIGTEGWLEKRSPAFHRKWQTRWCVIRQGKLFYYHPENRGSPAGVLPLINIVSVQESSPATTCTFKIHTHKRTYDFRATNATSMKSWASSISKGVTAEKQRRGK
eukprot:TRINITY_DN574_c0_g2_i3.p1 TRINITY_DN574_c0_g2~~TRINITY_DN574_c0_g2_i3.p1  ORF type:complete len:916 (+),score=234.34 TRINITY_DN574_c0_g2_i3:401-2749(+)